MVNGTSSDAPADVLVVEDDDALRDLLAEVLREDGFAVRTADDGRSALRAIESGRTPDVALVDLRLPGGVGGDEVCRRLRRRGGPVLLCSASEELGRAARESAATDWIAKPFDLEDLRSRVRRLAARRGR